jgi:hypothetical protein
MPLISSPSLSSLSNYSQTIRLASIVFPALSHLEISITFCSRPKENQVHQSHINNDPAAPFKMHSGIGGAGGHGSGDGGRKRSKEQGGTSSVKGYMCGKPGVRTQPLETILSLTPL